MDALPMILQRPEWRTVEGIEEIAGEGEND